MIGAIRSELRKLTTTRNPRSLMLIGTALIMLFTWGSLTATEAMGVPLDRQLFVRGIVPQLLFTLALVLGIRGFTDEFRHGSIVPTMLATPDRRRVLIAKVAAIAVGAAVYALLAEVAAVGLGAAIMTWKGMALSLAVGPLARELALIALATVGWSVIGVGIGALVKHQVAAIVGSLVWLLIGEGIVAVYLPSAAKFLPGSASMSMIGTAVGDGSVILPALAGAAVFAGWMLALVTGGGVALERRDVA